MADDTPVTRLTLPSIPEFKVWMTTEGEETPLYGVEVSGNKTICYAEAKTGQKFAIHFSDDRDFITVGLTVELHMYGQWARVVDMGVKGPQEFVLSARRDGPASERPFTFEDIKTTDNEKLACTDKAIQKSLGIINLVINRWVDKEMKIRPSAARDSMYSTVSEPTIHEDKKKAMVSHAIAFGDARPAAPTSTRSYYYEYHYVDTQKDFPFYKFEFRCRSREILEAQDLIPMISQDVVAQAESSMLDESFERPRSELSYSPSPGPPEYSESTSESWHQSSSTISDNSHNSVNSDVKDQNEIDPEDKLAELQDELAQLKLEKLEREIAAMERQIERDSSMKQLKRGVVNGNAEKSEVKKEVKLEREGTASSSNGTKKGKGKEVEVLVLSDSD